MVPADVHLIHEIGHRRRRAQVRVLAGLVVQQGDVFPLVPEGFQDRIGHFDVPRRKHVEIYCQENTVVLPLAGNVILHLMPCVISFCVCYRNRHVRNEGLNLLLSDRV